MLRGYKKNAILLFLYRMHSWVYHYRKIY